MGDVTHPKAPRGEHGYVAKRTAERMLYSRFTESFYHRLVRLSEVVAKNEEGKPSLADIIRRCCVAGIELIENRYPEYATKTSPKPNT